MHRKIKDPTPRTKPVLAEKQKIRLDAEDKEMKALVMISKARNANKQRPVDIARECFQIGLNQLRQQYGIVC